MLSWNCVGAPEAERFLFSLVEKDFTCQCGCSGRHTLEPLLQVFCWSMECIMMGKFPGSRHDKAPWTHADKHRASLSSQSLPKGGLMLMRGDWAWYKQVFAFPGWANNNICWCCNASRGGDYDFKQVSLKAPWRKTRFAKLGLFCTGQGEGNEPSCRISLPGFTRGMVAID